MDAENHLFEPLLNYSSWKWIGEDKSLDLEQNSDNGTLSYDGYLEEFKSYDFQATGNVQKSWSNFTSTKEENIDLCEILNLPMRYKENAKVLWTELSNDSTKLLVHCFVEKGYLLCFDILSNMWKLLSAGSFNSGIFLRDDSETVVAIQETKVNIFNLSLPFSEERKQKQDAIYQLQNNISQFTSQGMISNGDSVILYENTLAIVTNLYFPNSIESQKILVSIYSYFKGEISTRVIKSSEHVITHVSPWHLYKVSPCKISAECRFTSSSSVPEQSQLNFIFWVESPFKAFVSEFGNTAVTSSSRQLVGVFDSNDHTEAHLFFMHELRAAKKRRMVDETYTLPEPLTIRSAKRQNIVAFDCFDEDSRIITVFEPFDIGVLEIKNGNIKEVYFIRNPCNTIYGFSLDSHIIAFLKENQKGEVHLCIFSQQVGVVTHKYKIKSLIKKESNIKYPCKVHLVKNHQCLIVEDMHKNSLMRIGLPIKNNISFLSFKNNQSLKILAISPHGKRAAFSYSKEGSFRYGFFELSNFSLSRLILKKIDLVPTSPLVFSPDDQYLVFLATTKMGTAIAILDIDLNIATYSSPLNSILSVSDTLALGLVIPAKCFNKKSKSLLVTLAHWSLLRERVVLVSYDTANGHKEEKLTDITTAFSAYSFNDSKMTVCLLFVRNSVYVEVWSVTQMKRINVIMYDNFFKDIYMSCENIVISKNGNFIVARDISQKRPILINPDSLLEERDFLSSRDSFNSSSVAMETSELKIYMSKDDNYAFYIQKKNEKSFLKLVSTKDLNNKSNGSIHKSIFSYTDTDDKIPNTNVKDTLLVSADLTTIGWMRSKSSGTQVIFCNSIVCLDGCVVDYTAIKILKGSKPVSEDVSHLCCENLINRCDKDGWSLVMRAVEDENVQVVKYIINWAIENECCLCLVNQNPPHSSSISTEPFKKISALRLAIITEQLECARVLIRGMLSEISPIHQTAFILRECIDDLIYSHKSIFIDMIHDFRFLRRTATIEVPSEAFKNSYTPVLTASDSASCPAWSFQSSKSTKLQAISYVLPLEGIFSGRGDIIRKLEANGLDKETFDALPLACVIEKKWSSFAMHLVTVEIIKYILFLLTFTTYAVMLGEDKKILSYPRVCWTCLSISMFLSFLNLLNEFSQIMAYIRKSKSLVKGIYRWLKSKFNLCEFITYILILFPVPILHHQRHIIGLPAQRSLSKLVAIAAFFIWWKTLYFFLPFRSTGPMIIMIFEIINDISVFIILTALVMVGFGTSFYVLFQLDASSFLEDEVIGAFGSFERSLITTFGMMLGNFDQNLFYESRDMILAVIMFVLYMMVMMIILLNMLIAIMGDSFARIKQREEANFLSARAEVILDMENITPRFMQRKLRKHSRRYLHILLPKSYEHHGSHNQEDSKEMHQMIRTAISSHMDVAISKIESRIESKLKKYIK